MAFFCLIRFSTLVGATRWVAFLIVIPAPSSCHSREGGNPLFKNNKHKKYASSAKPVPDPDRGFTKTHEDKKTQKSFCHRGHREHGEKQQNKTFGTRIARMKERLTRIKKMGKKHRLRGEMLSPATRIRNPHRLFQRYIYDKIFSSFIYVFRKGEVQSPPVDDRRQQAWRNCQSE